MNASTVYPKLTEIFRSVFDDDKLDVKPSLSARDLNGWDSLRNIRLMLAIEKSFRVRFTASEIGKLESVGDLAILLESKLSS